MHDGKAAHQRLSRRGFLQIACSAGISLLAACSPAAPPRGGAQPEGAPISTGVPTGPQSGAPTQGPQQQAPASANPGGKLVVALSGEPSSVFPEATAAGIDTRRVTSPLFDTLVRPTMAKYGEQPGLAESWELTGGTVYTFKLRKAAKFQDGTPFTAEAVKAAFDRQLDPSSEWAKLIKLNSSGRLDPVKSYRIIDDFTFEATLKSPLPAFPSYLTSTVDEIFSPTAARTAGPQAIEQPVGTGPFKFGGWERGVRLIHERNGDYWGGPPKLDQVIFVVIPESQARLTALKTGQVDLMMDIPPDQVQDIQQDSNLTLLKLEKPSHVWYLVPSFKNFDAFKDKRVRQALAHAIDREALTKDILKGTGLPARNLLAPAFEPYVDTTIPGYTFNPDKAKQLLADAGHPNGFEVEWTIPESGGGFQQPVAMATLIQANLATVGIKASIKTMELPTFQDTFNKGNFQLSVRSWSSIIGDPDNPLYFILHSDRMPPQVWNGGSHSNPEYDRLITTARGELDQNKRLELYRQAQQYIFEEQPVIPVDHEITMVAMAKKVKGFQIHPNFNLYFQGTTVA